MMGLIPETAVFAPPALPSVLTNKAHFMTKEDKELGYRMLIACGFLNSDRTVNWDFANEQRISQPKLYFSSLAQYEQLQKLEPVQHLSSHFKSVRVLWQNKKWSIERFFHESTVGEGYRMVVIDITRQRTHFPIQSLDSKLLYDYPYQIPKYVKERAASLLSQLI